MLTHVCHVSYVWKMDMGVRSWPFREAQQTHLSVSFGENEPLNSMNQQR
ncbi:MAG: hypothetical protein ACYTBY_05455 [Planctomycetota bacterium]